MSRKPTTEYHNELFDKIWKTKGSRFNAYERLRKKHKLSIFTTSLLSAYMIIVNLLEPFGIIDVCHLSKNIVSFTSVALSIIILVFVLIESARDYSTRAEKYLECAKELAKLYNNLEQHISRNNIDDELMEKLSFNYSVIIEKYDNHIPLDYELHKAKSPKAFELTNTKRLWVLFKVSTIINWKYHLFIILPPFFFILLLLLTNGVFKT